MDGRLGPFRCEGAYGSDSGVVRVFACPEYVKCLRIASIPNWSSFTCKGCVKEFDSQAEERVFPDQPYVPLGIFIKRIELDPERRGLTVENFSAKIDEEIRQYYGDKSIEYAFIRSKLRFLRAIIDEDVGNISTLETTFDIFSGQFADVPDLQELYLKVSGFKWALEL